MGEHMLRRTGLVVGLLLFAVSSTGQTTANRDPISGDWGTDGRRLLELKFDGKQTVTGTVFFYRKGALVSSAAIQTGSFSLREGLLKLAGEVTVDGKSMPYVIEGTLENDVLNVTLKAGNDEFSVILKKL
jgi:hypothetical protein